MTEIINLLEIIGTIAFAVSGALIACGAGLDLFGVVFVGCITAFGGGMIRDVLLGITPPAIFSNFPIFIIAVASTLTVFAIAYAKKQKFDTLKSGIEFINNYFDAVGLAAFSVTGAEIAFARGYEDNVLIVITMGMITGVGGGIMRDIMIDTTPYVFKKHVYAVASIVGALVYYGLRMTIKSVSACSGFAMLCVIAIRILATRLCWSLPKISTKTNDAK